MILSIKRLIITVITGICLIWTTGIALGQARFPNETPEQQRYDREFRLRETPRFLVKTNLFYNLTTSPNIAAEARLARKWSFELPFAINPWTFNKEENVKFKFALVQPELRFWTCEVFNGHFFGLHGHYGIFNVSKMPNPPFSENMHQRRYQGRLHGVGVSYGFQWVTGRRWGWEFEIGAGYAKLEYDRYPCDVCIREHISKTRNYFGLTRLGLNLVYIIF